jgi:opacity protein-like surface antigen
LISSENDAGGFVRKIVAIAVGVMCAAMSAHAQIPTSGNIFFGYSYSGGDVFVHGVPEVQSTSHSASFNGWEGSLEEKLLPWIGIVGDVGGTYGSHNIRVCSFVLPPCRTVNLSANRYTFLVGPRVSIPIGKFTPFAHVLVGAGHVSDNGSGLSNSDTSLATAVGGGLDYRLIKGVAWRVQGDEVHTRFFGSTQDHFRFSTGIDFRF